MEDIEVEFYSAGKNLLLILTGIGGTTKGFQNKYEKIAKQVVEKYNYSVIVATSPKGSWQHTKENLDYIMTVVNKKEFHNIFAMGSSAGANILLMHAYEFPKIKKILAINPILNINLHKINNGIDLFNGKTTLICGEDDMSNKFKEIVNKKAKTITIPNADHNFTNQLKVYIKLYEYLFN